MAWRTLVFLGVAVACAGYAPSGGAASPAKLPHGVQAQVSPAGRMLPGAYHTTVTYSDVRGLPPAMARRMTSRPHTADGCLKTSDINAVVQDEIAAGGGMTCSQDHGSASGGVISGAANCRDDQGSSGTLTLRGSYNATHAEVSADLRATTQMGPMSEHMHLVSDRTGAC
jgi:hypothetical protein